MFPPELFILVGVNVFVALSLLTSIFDGLFPAAVPYVFQIAALAGFGQIWMNYAFLFYFVESRFWCSALYLFVAVISVIAVNLHIAIRKRLLSAAVGFFGAFTIPIIFLSYFFVSSCVNGLVVSIPPLPIVPVGSLYVVLSACMVILGLSVVIYLEPSTLKRLFKSVQKHQHGSLNPASSPTDDPEENEGEGGGNVREAV
ncbi:MAG: hypothetical protein QXP36_07375 [Conexivisphaerales archaeon]